MSSDRGLVALMHFISLKMIDINDQLQTSLEFLSYVDHSINNISPSDSRLPSTELTVIHILQNEGISGMESVKTRLGESNYANPCWTVGNAAGKSIASIPPSGYV